MLPSSGLRYESLFDEGPGSHPVWLRMRHLLFVTPLLRVRPTKAILHISHIFFDKQLFLKISSNLDFLMYYLIVFCATKIINSNLCWHSHAAP